MTGSPGEGQGLEVELNVEEDSARFLLAAEEQERESEEDPLEQRNALIDELVFKSYERKFLSLELDEGSAEPYNALMTNVDIQFGGYSKYLFYKLQLVFESNAQVFILFTRWGRI